MSEVRRARSPAGPALLVVCGAASQVVGAALAVGLFGVVGAPGVVFLRLAIGGALLCAVTRPRLRGLSRRAWCSAVMLAATVTLMNLCFYSSLTRIPLGIAVTIEVVGPLILSVAVSTRRVAWLWALLAFAGVALLAVQKHAGTMNWVGFLFAAGAGAGWAAYILASARAGTEFPRVDGLAVASVMGAAVLAPVVLTSLPASALDGKVIALGGVVAVLATAIPYSLDLLSLRYLSPETFAVLTCLTPISATVAGWLLLGQRISALGCLAMLLVVVASVGAVCTARTAPQGGGGVKIKALRVQPASEHKVEVLSDPPRWRSR